MSARSTSVGYASSSSRAVPGALERRPRTRLPHLHHRQHRRNLPSPSLSRACCAPLQAQCEALVRFPLFPQRIHCRMPPPPRARISVGACAHHHSRCTPLRPRVNLSLPLDATACAWLRAPGLASLCRGARSLPCPRSPATSATRCCFALLPCCWDSCAATAQAGRCYFCYCSAVATAEARHRLLMLLRCRCCFAVLLPLLPCSLLLLLLPQLLLLAIAAATCSRCSCYCWPWPCPWSRAPWVFCVCVTGWAIAMETDPD